jgi:hypothetical protein
MKLIQFCPYSAQRKGLGVVGEFENRPLTTAAQLKI